MKNLLLALAFVAVFPTLSNAALDYNLRYAMSGVAVTELQEYLVTKGFLDATPTGFFGPMTLDAVKRYQASNNIESTGFVGPITRAKINADLAVYVEEADEAELAETGSVSTIVTNDTTKEIKELKDKLDRQEAETKKAREEAKKDREKIAKAVGASVEEELEPVEIEVDDVVCLDSKIVFPFTVNGDWVGGVARVYSDSKSHDIKKQLSATLGSSMELPFANQKDLKEETSPYGNPKDNPFLNNVTFRYSIEVYDTVYGNDNKKIIKKEEGVLKIPDCN